MVKGCEHEFRRFGQFLDDSFFCFSTLDQDFSERWRGHYDLFAATVEIRKQEINTSLGVGDVMWSIWNEHQSEKSCVERYHTTVLILAVSQLPHFFQRIVQRQ